LLQLAHVGHLELGQRWGRLVSKGIKVSPNDAVGVNGSSNRQK
jgi:hypothetical protein